jgi:AraC-like DNA-binding protein
VALLLGANTTGGHGVLDVTQRLYYAEVASACIYAVMQFNYTGQLWREFRCVRLALENYYDRERHGVIRWMRNSCMLLSLSAVFAPMVIFWSGPLLIVYALTIMLCISYTVISFYGYGLDRRHLQALQEVERSMQEDEQAESLDRQDNGSDLSDRDRQHVGKAVERWLAKGGHLHSGITIQTAADDMRIPRYQLKLLLKTTEQKLFNPWLTNLRIEEAKRQLKKHPEWSNDTIAEHCGFSSRNYFQTIFKKQTGVSPSEFS